MLELMPLNDASTQNIATLIARLEGELRTAKAVLARQTERQNELAKIGVDLEIALSRSLERAEAAEKELGIVTKERDEARLEAMMESRK